MSELDPFEMIDKGRSEAAIDRCHGCSVCSWQMAQPSLGGKYILGFKLLAQCKAPSSADTFVRLEIPATIAEVVGEAVVLIGVV